MDKQMDCPSPDLIDLGHNEKVFWPSLPSANAKSKFE